MALAGGDVIGTAAPSRVLVSTSGEWDGVVIFSQVRGKNYSLGLTTDLAGTSFARALVRSVVGRFRAAIVPGGGALRTPPFGLPDAEVNWVHELPAAVAQWTPARPS